MIATTSLLAYLAINHERLRIESLQSLHTGTSQQPSGVGGILRAGVQPQQGWCSRAWLGGSTQPCSKPSAAGARLGSAGPCAGSCWSRAWCAGATSAGTGRSAAGGRLRAGVRRCPDSCARLCCAGATGCSSARSTAGAGLPAGGSAAGVRCHAPSGSSRCVCCAPQPSVRAAQPLWHFVGLHCTIQVDGCFWYSHAVPLPKAHDARLVLQMLRE